MRTLKRLNNVNIYLNNKIITHALQTEFVTQCFPVITMFFFTLSK